MMLLPAGVRVHIALGVTDLRKGLDGLAMLVQGVLEQDPFSGHLFAFRGRKANLVKILFWDGTGCQRRSKNRPRGGVKVCRLGSVRSLSPKSTGGTRARRGLLLIGQRPWRAWEGPVGPRGQADAARSG